MSAGDDTAPAADEMPDLLAALQASVDRARATSARAPRSRATKPATGYTVDSTGRRIDDGWDHDGDLMATFQGDLNRQRQAGDRLADAAKQVRMVNGAPVGLDALADAVEAWEENR